jgi:hypothetical protein
MNQAELANIVAEMRSQANNEWNDKLGKHADKDDLNDWADRLTALGSPAPNAEALRALVRKWRAHFGGDRIVSGEWNLGYTGAGIECANELEAALGSGPDGKMGEAGASGPTETPTVEALRAALLECARMAEALKLPCGDDPESAQAIRNGQYASISHVAHIALGTIKGAAIQTSAQIAWDLRYSIDYMITYLEDAPTEVVRNWKRVEASAKKDGKQLSALNVTMCEIPDFWICVAGDGRDAECTIAFGPIKRDDPNKGEVERELCNQHINDLLIEEPGKQFHLVAAYLHPASPSTQREEDHSIPLGTDAIPDLPFELDVLAGHIGLVEDIIWDAENHVPNHTTDAGIGGIRAVAQNLLGGMKGTQERLQACVGKGTSPSNAESCSTQSPLLTKGVPAGGEAEPVAWQYRYIDPQEGPGLWQSLHEQNLETIRRRKDHEVRALYTHPPLAKAPLGDMVLVPREPTQAMREAAANAAVPDNGTFYYPFDANDIQHAYKAMIAAAPPPAEPHPETPKGEE